MKICIIGCGDIGLRTSKLLQTNGHQVTGARRKIGSLPGWIDAHYCDVTEPASLNWLADLAPDIVIYSVAASSFTEEAYQRAYVDGVRNTVQSLAGAKNPLSRFIFVSSTGVYQQNDGSAVTEKSATKPLRFNGRLMLQGELAATTSGVATCVRFSGIYGPGRLRIINRVASGNLTPVANDKLSNRIHVDDCAAVLAHVTELALGDNCADCYLASDCMPASSVEVEQFIAAELGLQVTEPARRATNQSGRIAGSKRCDNALLLASGYRFIHPDYRSGYRALIADLKR